MKTYTLIFTTIVCIISFSCFGQRANQDVVVASIESTSLQSDKQDSDRVIVAYYVEETINMAFGKRVTKYEVSKLDMVNTYDLGPNNTRIVTPIYRKSKVKPTEAVMQAKVITEIPDEIIKPVKADVIPPSEIVKYVSVDVLTTYAKVLDKGYKSADMLKKVADRAYFDGNLEEAVKYYTELLDITTDLDAVYYYRYAQSLKGIEQSEKATEMMILFESKNRDNTVAKK